MTNVSKSIRCVLAGMFLLAAASAAAQYPTGEQVMQQEMAKARAAKARNDMMVDKQRAAERAKKPVPKPSPSSSDQTKAKTSPPAKSK